jgi:predicted regulator of Ras-like GTPase activity (Roadblock/LC7/MglB family)
MISATRALRELSTPPPAAASAKSAGEPARIAMIKPAGDKERLSMVKPGGDTERLAIAAKTAASSEAARPEVELPTLLVALTALAEAWPEPVRKEIVEANLVDAKVALPHDSVKQALKQGRIAFSWKALRSWITSPVSPLSPHDSLVLELPLRVVAPLFLARQQEDQKAQHKVSVDVEIPNLFFGFPQSESGANPQVGGDAPPQVAGRSSDTNYYVWDDSSDVARVDSSAEKRAPTPGTKFVAKYATPNEVVSRAAALEGVAGSLIALPDGLMVANQVPSELNADTIAAFLPQIFGKVSACTKELRMGDLNNLNFTVGNVPWKIFRVNAIFFAAFGRPGQPLPTAELASLAGELDHKPK